MTHTVLGTGNPNYLFSCEHGGNDLFGTCATAEERRVLADHWGYDPGAADLTRAMVRRTGARAVIANFSRLLIDPNRAEEATTLIPLQVGGLRLAFNYEADKAERLARFYTPYHRALGQEASRAQKGAVLISVHSFTRHYPGSARRDFEVGVLFDDYEEQAMAVAAHLDSSGIQVRLNEPYSGKKGLIYSAARHGRAHGLRYVEFEVRNDLLVRNVDRYAEHILRAVLHAFFP